MAHEPLTLTPRADFSPRVRGFLQQRDGVFRIDSGTVGIAEPELMEKVISARPVLPSERSVFKPVRDVAIDDETANSVIRSLGHDVARTVDLPVPDLSGCWPRRGQEILREMLFSIDCLPVSLLQERRLAGSDVVSTLRDITVAATPHALVAAGARSALAGLLTGRDDYARRRRVIALYRRASAVFIDGLASLVSNAAWLRPPNATAENVPELLWETLRLLPPAWMLWRNPDPGFAHLHPLLRPTDALAILPLVMHRDAALWKDATSFQPGRWLGADPTRTRGFVPFGLAGTKCWARHLVLPLAQRLLTAVIEQDLRPRTPDVPAPVPLRPLLSVRVELVPRR